LGHLGHDEGRQIAAQSHGQDTSNDKKRQARITAASLFQLIIIIINIDRPICSLHRYSVGKIVQKIQHWSKTTNHSAYSRRRRVPRGSTSSLSLLPTCTSVASLGILLVEIPVV
jgi:hypothetical protein